MENKDTKPTNVAEITATDQSNILQINGAMLEGGGQLFRTTIALSQLLNRGIHVTNIRKTRQKSNGKGGGLGNQHLVCLDAFFQQFFNLNGTNYKLEGNSKGSMEVLIQPNVNQRVLLDEQFIQKHPQGIIIKQNTPGSINLIIQCFMPCLLFQAYDKINMKISGGTLTSKQPSIGNYKKVLIPILEQMGAQISYEVGRHGLMPDVIGGVAITINSLKGKPLKPISLMRRGGKPTDDGDKKEPETLIIDLYVYSTEGPAFNFYANYFSVKAEEAIRKMLIQKYKEIAQINIHENDPASKSKVVNTNIEKKQKNKGANTFFCDAIVSFGESKSTLFCDTLIEKFDDKKEYQSFYNFINDLCNGNINKEEVVVNERLADQLLIYMALADGKSEMVMGDTEQYSKHFMTQVKLLKLMIPGLEIQITEHGSTLYDQPYKYNTVEVKGIGIK